ncbi:MAG: hypothetical protein JO290_02865 [Sphingomonadaceae bacterium]|nr:hypothetical protein [Sphingomonadaceae bacterium]
MKMTLESTDQVVEVRVAGTIVPARVWEGTTERGVPVQALITRVAVAGDADHFEFDADLIPCRSKPPSLRAFPIRLIL